MPYISEHAPKVSTLSVNPYARESSPQKLQQDGQTQMDCPKPLFSTEVVSQTRSHLYVDFLHDANTSMGHGSRPKKSFWKSFFCNFLNVEKDFWNFRVRR